jgi:hypothetical protein
MIDRTTVLTAVTVLYALLVGAVVVRGLYHLHVESGNSLAHNLGQASGYVSLLFRDPLRGVIVIVALIITLIVFSGLDVFDEATASDDNRPPIAPIQATNLRMPTTYPFTRVCAAWPPFIGHRVPLGSDRP